MAFTLAQLQALDDAIASGRLTVSYNGRSVTYRSIDDLIKARNLARADLVASGQLAESPSSNRGPASITLFSRN